jgi:predicted secreted protein
MSAKSFHAKMNQLAIITEQRTISRAIQTSPVSHFHFTISTHRCNVLEKLKGDGKRLYSCCTNVCAAATRRTANRDAISLEQRVYTRETEAVQAVEHSWGVIGHVSTFLGAP